MEIPFYLPTSFGDLAVGATVHPGSLEQGCPVMFMPGGQNPRGRDRVRLEIARDLAKLGRPVFRIDYPGAGLSPTTAANREELVGMLLQAVSWIRDACGVDRIAVGGTCGGAVHAIALAARDPAIHSVVAIDCPITGRGRRTKQKATRRFRAGLAAIDVVGTRATSFLVGGGQAEPEVPWFPELVDDLAAASRNARIAFVNGEDDIFFSDLRRLMGSGVLSPEVMDRWTLEVRPRSQLYGFRDPDDMKWVREVVVSFLLRSEAIHS